MRWGGSIDALKKAKHIEKNSWVIAGALDGAWLTDLRHTFAASTALAVGQGLHMIARPLGHTQVQTTAHYAHLAAEPVKTAANDVSAILAVALSA